MNARDSLKPKSIRVAILQALSDGAITTIDDLQIKMDEKREKITSNVYPAAAEGLIKRMRDDVTGAAAYQITQKGRDLLAKYASGKAVAPADVVETEKATVKESLTVPAPEVSRRKSEAVAVEVLETAMPGFTAAVVAEKDAEIARLRQQYNEACVLVSRMHSAAMGRMCAPVVSVVDDIAEVRAQLDQISLMVRNSCSEAVTSDATTVSLLGEILHKAAHQYDPVGYLIQCPTKPFVRFAKHENAKARALAFARSGKRAQVFALIPVGSAVPGTEWIEG